MMRHFATLIIMLGLMSGCTPQPLQLPATPPTPLNVFLTPSTEIWVGAVNRCGSLNSTLNAFIHVQRMDTDQLDDLSVTIHSGETGAVGKQFKLTDEELIIIVHPDNPLSEISDEQFAAVLTGFTRTWSEVDPNLVPEFGQLAVQPVIYPSEDELEQILSQHFMGDLVPSLGAKIVNNPAEMVELVSQTPGAIGFIPKRWLVSSIKQLVPSEKIIYPLIMVTKAEPADRLKQLMLCLQDQAKQAK